MIRDQRIAKLDRKQMFCVMTQSRLNENVKIPMNFFIFIQHIILALASIQKPKKSRDHADAVGSSLCKMRINATRSIMLQSNIEVNANVAK